MRDALIRLLQLAWFMAPACCANMAPPFVRYWHGWNRPISQRWFGSHKTVVGFALGVAAALAATALQGVLDAPFSIVDYEHWIVLGSSFGVGAMTGDLAKSFFKRRAGIAPGAMWLPFDQLDFAIGALALSGWRADLQVRDVLVILAMTFVGHIAINRLAFQVGIKSTPW
jgi:CDP-2,3-bis-(O-geranylgeranyl)-sn-glycerol synthase